MRLKQDFLSVLSAAIDGASIKMYIEKQIKNLNNEDRSVAVSGFVVSKDESSFILDDRTSQIIILSKEEVNIGDYIRVFGNLILDRDEKLIQAGIIQNLNNINKEMHQKILQKL